MLNNILDPVTGLPLKFGEIFSDRNLKVVGSARWDAATGSVQTRNLSLVLSPIDGGSPAVTVIPDSSYPLSANASVWVQVRRTSGTSTVVLGSSLLADISSQEKPKQNWIQLFIRTANDEVVTFGNWLILGGTTWTKIGVTTASGVYDSIVGPSDNPFATHTSIQGAIDDAADGSRILVLQGVYSIETAQKADLSATSAFAWSGKTVTLEGEGFGTVIENNAGLANAFYIASTSATSNASQGNGSKIVGVHLKNFDQTVVLDGGLGNGVRSCVVEVYNTSTTSSTLAAPSRLGTGTFDLNTIKEFVTRSNSFSIREYYLANSTLTNTMQATGNEVFDSTSSRRLSIKTALRVGDTTTPTRTLDVIGDIRATSGNFYSPAAALLLMSDTGSSLPMKVGSLTVSNSYSDNATSQGLLVRGNSTINGTVVLGTDNNQSVTINSPVFANKTVRIGDNNTATKTLDVVGTMRTTAGQIYSSATSLTLYTDSSASLPLKAGSLTLSNNYADTAGTQGLLVRGSGQIDGSVALGTDSAQSVTINSPAYAIVSLRVGDNTLATRTLDVAGSIRTTAGQIYSPATYLGLLTDSGAALPVKVGSLVISSSYSDTVGASGLLVKDAAQIDGVVTLNNLGASQVVITNASKALTTVSYGSGNVGSAIVQRDSTGGISVGTLNAGQINSADIYATGWLRTYGQRGWYSQDYGGGIYMVDTTWVRTYNNKNFYCSQELRANRITTEGGITASGNITANGDGGVFSNRGDPYWARILHSGSGGNCHIDTGSGNMYFNWFNGGQTFYFGNSSGSYKYLRVVDGEFNLIAQGDWIGIQGNYGQTSTVVKSPGGSYTTTWPGGWGGGLATFDITCSSIRFGNGSTQSDIRAKERIVPISSALATILKFNPVSFYWKKEVNQYVRNKQFGFIAQEVEAFAPELVDDGGWDDDNEVPGFKSMNYIALIPILAGAVKDLNNKCTDLEAKIASFTSSV